MANPEELKNQVKWEKYRRDKETFIEDNLKIEDRDHPGVVIPFQLWEGQRGALRAFLRDRLIIILKARQLGLSWLALAYALTMILFNEGFFVVALSKREDPDAKELVRKMKFMLRHLPDWIIREKGTKKESKDWDGPTWYSTALSVVIETPGFEPSIFQSMTSSPESGRSFTANLVLLDEWAFQEHAAEIWDAGYPVINRPTGGQVIGLSTGKRGTLFEDIWSKAYAGQNNFTPIFLPWYTDPRRNEDWYERTKKDLPNSYRREYPTTPEEAFMVGEGAFFPEWDMDIHVLRDRNWYPPEYCQIYGAYDAGYGSRACFKWYAVFPEGHVVCYREYYPHQVTDSEQAEHVIELSKDLNGAPENIVMIYADPSCWNKQSGTGESTAEVFLKKGLRLLPADNDLSNGWRRLHQWLKPREDGVPLLRFTWNCPNSIRTYPACEQSKTNPEDIAKSCEHHPQDVDRYFVMGRPQPRKGVERPKRNNIPPELRTPETTKPRGGYLEWG